MASAARYTLTGKSLAKVAGQQGLVFRTLETLGSATVAELATAIAPDVNTVQTPERIAAYYVCVLKKSGHVAEAATGEPTIEALVAERDRLAARLDEVVAIIEAARAKVAAEFEADVEVDAN